MHAMKHFHTITHHRILVMKGCFKVGLYWQGLCHDLSKYSPSEFMVGAKFYQGDRSPNNAEREEYGFSSAWLHHKGRNKHHYEYWIDYSSRYVKGGMAPAPMPTKYIVEMLMDRIAACKTYNKERYTCKNPWEYYTSGKDPAPIHDKTRAMLELFLKMIAIKGEEYAQHYIKKEILPKRKELDDPEKIDQTIKLCKQKMESLMNQ